MVKSTLKCLKNYKKKSVMFPNILLVTFLYYKFRNNENIAVFLKTNTPTYITKYTIKYYIIFGK